MLARNSTALSSEAFKAVMIQVEVILKMEATWTFETLVSYLITTIQGHNLKMDAAWTFETLVSYHNTTRRHYPQLLDLNTASIYAEPQTEL
jgi:hypothetical protein